MHKSQIVVKFVFSVCLPFLHRLCGGHGPVFLTYFQLLAGPLPLYEIFPAPLWGPSPFFGCSGCVCFVSVYSLISPLRASIKDFLGCGVMSSTDCSLFLFLSFVSVFLFIMVVFVLCPCIHSLVPSEPQQKTSWVVGSCLQLTVRFFFFSLFFVSVFKKSLSIKVCLKVGGL